MELERLLAISQHVTLFQLPKTQILILKIMAFSFLVAREKVKILQTVTNHILKKAQPVNSGHFTAMLQTYVNRF